MSINLITATCTACTAVPVPVCVAMQMTVQAIIALRYYIKCYKNVLGGIPERSYEN